MIKQIIKNIKVLIPRRHIFLVSHMRANTSLLGHILGSSDDISGYYETHKSYHSWKSLIRQRLFFHQSHPGSRLTYYYFDKLLHNIHYLEDSVFRSKRLCFIFMLRGPERSVKSICHMYQKLNPENKIAQGDGAAEYYIERLHNISNIVGDLRAERESFYLDAESLVDDTEHVLSCLTDWLALKVPLTFEYRQFKFTGEKKYGDPFENIRQGSIIPSRGIYDEILVDPVLMRKCHEVYNETRTRLINKCRHSVLLTKQASD